MVDVGKLQKINELANELKKHNFAATNDEAAKLAEEFYKENKTEIKTVKQQAAELAEEFYSRRDGMNIEKQTQKTEDTEQLKQSSAQTTNQEQTENNQTNPSKIMTGTEAMDAMTEKKIELLIEMQNKKITEELDLMRTTINFLKTRMETLNKEVEKLKGKALSSPITFENKEDQKEVQANLKKEKKEEQKDSPRSGKYSSKDVDIQKMFYFGNK